MNNSKRDEFLALAAREGKLPTGKLAGASAPRTFMDRALANELLSPIDEFHAAVEAWHEMTGLPTVYDYLGMTRVEYARAVGGDGDLLGVIADRKAQRSIP